jgi:uncharacterized protein YyaL (SSP411 family)
VQAGGRPELLDRAEEIAALITDPGSQAEALVAIVQAGGRPELLDRAEEIAALITDPRSQAEALVAIVQAGGRPELLDRAEKIAAQIPDRGFQALALVAIVQAGGRPKLRDTASNLVVAQVVNTTDTTSWFASFPTAISVLRDCGLMHVIRDAAGTIVEIDRDFFGASTRPKATD